MDSVELADRAQPYAAELEAKELPPTDRGRGAYSFLLAALLLETFVFGFSYSYSSILVYFESHDPWQKQSISALSAVGTTQLGMQFILPIFFVNAARRYPDYVKPALWVSTFITSGAYLIASWTTKAEHLIVLLGVIGGTANAVLFTPVWYLLSQWFVVRRGFAYGVIVSGIGLGGLIFPFILDGLLKAGGFALMARVWAGVQLAVFSTSTLLIKPRIPAVKPAEGGRSPWLAVDLSFLKKPIFILTAIASVLSSLSYLPVALFLPVYTSAFTTSSFQQNLVLSIFNLFAAIGSALSGRVADWSYSTLIIACGALSALVSLTAWGLADSLAKVYGFAVLFALTSQSVPSWSGAAGDLAQGNSNTATMVLCFFSVVRGIGSIVLPFVADKLVDTKQLHKEESWGSFGFQKTIVFVGITAALSGLAGLGLIWARKSALASGRRN
ncbi:hypothetical protein JCM8547_005735 [Rhodosporidiobolus lusitaniae]